jgi:hypothetical protein
LSGGLYLARLFAAGHKPRAEFAMKTRCEAIVLLAGLSAVAGCAGPEVRAHIDSVNSEYRQLEDYVYCLEDENAKLSRRLDHVQGNYERVLRGEEPLRPSPFRRGADESSGGTSDEQPPQIEVPGVSSGSSSSTNRSTLQRLDLGAPAVEIPEPGNAAPATDELPTPAIPRTSTPRDPEVLPVMPADTKITHLFLNPLQTGGVDFDRQPGDEGLTVVLEPRNAGDEYVPQAGAVSIVVVDPSRQDDSARIARWDFTLSATQQKLETAGGRGIQLEMPWPASPPTANQLKLFVRYETADGRRLQTDRDIYITPPGQVAQRWTPRPPDRVRPPASVASAPQPAATPPAASESPAVKLLTPPPATIDEPKDKPVVPKWSPNR